LSAGVRWWIIQVAARATRVEYSPLPLPAIGSLVFGAPPARTSVVEHSHYPTKLFKTGDSAHPMREDVKQKQFSTPLLETLMSAFRPLLLLLLVEKILVLTPGASQSTPGIRIAVAGLPGVVSCSGPDTIRCEAAQANRWLKCQPSSYM